MKSLFKIVPAQEIHLDQLIDLAAYTNYDIMTARYNTLKMSKESYIREYRIKPLLSFTVVAVEYGNEQYILGMAIFSAIEQLGLCRQKSYSHLQIQEIFKPYAEFKITNSYYISRMAVHKKWRRCGIGRMLMQFAESKTLENSLLYVSLLCWNGQRSAIKFFIDMGMTVTNTIMFNVNLPFRILLYFERNLGNITNIADYFDMPESHTLSLIKE